MELWGSLNAVIYYRYILHLNFVLQTQRWRGIATQQRSTTQMRRRGISATRVALSVPVTRRGHTNTLVVRSGNS